MIQLTRGQADPGPIRAPNQRERLPIFSLCGRISDRQGSPPELGAAVRDQNAEHRTSLASVNDIRHVIHRHERIPSISFTVRVVRSPRFGQLKKNVPFDRQNELILYGRVVLWSQMMNELTRTEKNSNDNRKACFNSQEFSVSGNQRDDELDHQGAQSDPPHTPVVNRVSPATVATAQPGGASSSKWTRKTRPWNVSIPTTVVASFSTVERTAQTRASADGSKSLPNHPPFSNPTWESDLNESGSTPRCSPVSRHRRRPPSFQKEASEASLPDQAVASTAPPSRFFWAGETEASCETSVNWRIIRLGHQ